MLDPKVRGKGSKEVNLQMLVGQMVKNLECKANASSSKCRDNRTLFRIRRDVVGLIHVSYKERARFYNPDNIYVDRHNYFSLSSLEGEYGWHRPASTMWLSGQLQLTQHGLLFYEIPVIVF